MTDFPITDLTSRPFAFVTRRCAYADMGRVMPAAFAEVAAALGRAGVVPEGPAWTRYTGWDETGARFDAGFACPEGIAPEGLSIGRTPGGTVMTGWHIGPYDGVAATYEAMKAAMVAAGVAPADIMWEAYHSPPGTPPDETRTEVVWPVT